MALNQVLRFQSFSVYVYLEIQRCHIYTEMRKIVKLARLKISNVRESAPKTPSGEIFC